MALIVENGTGLANAESLCDVAFFRDYHAKRGTDTSAITDEVAEQLLRKATDFIRYRFGEFFLSLPLNLLQSLPFPRIAYGLPTPVKEATAELALIAKTMPLMPTVSRGKKRVKVGPLEVEYDGNAASAPKFVGAVMRLSPYLSSQAFGSPTIAKLVRV